MNKKIWFSSDWHLDHKNIIKYDGRPFENVEQMNTTIINNYNNLVEDEDDFYFLGDFSFCRPEKTEWLLSQLKGNKYFIKGNHDKKDTIRLYQKYGIYLGELAEIEVCTQKIVLCHYAMRTWNKSHRGTWCLYGHSHHSLPDDKNSLSFDIGVNGWEYKPLEFSDVERIMSKKQFKPIDHHGE